MRSVSSATWTLVEPVSRSPEPNFAAISRLRSLVIAAIGADTLADPRRPSRASRAEQFARALHVSLHLRRQRGGAVEAALAAKALHELEAQIRAGEVAVEVQQEGLDQFAAAGLKSGPHADADRGRAVVGQARIHAVARARVRLVGDQVGGREAERAAALVAALDLAAELKARAEKAVRLRHVAGQPQAADVARGHDLARDLRQGGGGPPEGGRWG